jgi:hypothetical protein
MKKNKDIVKDALLTAKELEQAAKRNAHDTIIEAFTPRLTDVIRQTLNEEGPGPQLPDPVTKLAKGEEEEDEADGVVGNDAGSPEAIAPTQGDKEIAGKGKKHSIDKPAPAPGNMLESDDEDEDDFLGESDDNDEDDMMDEDREDRDGGLDPGRTASGGPNQARPTGINETDDDDEDDIGGDFDPEEDDELELEMDDDEMGMDPVEDEDDVFEEEGEDEELDIPDELFDDEDDQEVDGEPAPEDAEAELDIPAEDADEDDEALGEEDEELDIDIEDEPDMDQDMAMDDEEFEEGLYVRREGNFVKVDPAEALDARMKDLEEEREKLANAVGFLKGQLGEVNLFNAKMAHLVKLYESGLFSRPEKRRIAERLDNCKSVKQVNTVYKNIVTEADSRTVLDDIHDVITESRVRRNNKPSGESVYESAEVKRMKRLAGLED